MLNRRKVVQGLGAGVTALAAPSLVRAQELRKIRMGFGEPEVLHWHELNAGVAGRKPLISHSGPRAGQRAH